MAKFSKKQKNWQAEILEKVESAQENDWRQSSRYELLENFYSGNHYIEYNYSTRSYFNLPSRASDYGGEEQRLVFNVCGTSVDLVHGATSRKRPVFIVTAPPNEQRAEHISARALTRMIRRWFVSEGWDRHFKMARFNNKKLGNGVLKIGWTLKRGEKIYNPVYDPETDETTHEELPVGMPTFENIHPSQIHLPPSFVKERISESPWIIVERVMPVADIKREYGVEVDPDDELVYRAGSWGYFGEEPYRGDLNPQEHEAAVLYEYWERPTEEHENGRYILATKTKLIEAGDLPFDWCIEKEMLPFAWMSYKEDDRKLRTDGVIDPILEMNFHLNYILNKQALFALRQAHAKIIYPKDIGIDESVFENPDQIYLPYNRNATHPPAYMTPAGLPPVVRETVDFLLNHTQTITGMNEIMRGENPAAVRGIAHAALLNELTFQRLYPAVSSEEAALREAGKMVIYMLAERMPVEIGVKLAGPADETGWRIFKQKEKSADYQIQIDVDSLIPQSALVKRDQIMDDYESGFYGQPGSPEAVAKAVDSLGLLNPEEPNRRRELNENLIEREHLIIERIALGELSESDMPLPLEIEDRALHFEAHDDFGLENSDHSDPVQRAVYELTMAHVYLTEMQIQQQSSPMAPQEAFGQMGAQPQFPQMPPPGGMPPGAPPGAGGGTPGGGMIEPPLPMEQMPAEPMPPLPMAGGGVIE